MPTVSYPLDKTGIAASNKVPREAHTLTEVNANAYRILVLDFAPFYQDNFTLISVDANGVETVLRRDLDFTFTLPYASAIRALRKMVYGAVSISNKIVQGQLYATYQTMGGDEVADVGAVREKLYEIAYNPRTASWDVIANKPEQFPPEPHTQPLESLKGTEELIESIEEVAASIRQGPGSTTPFIKHMLDEENPHETNKEQVGLGLVENYPVADTDDIAGRKGVDKYILLRQALELFAAKDIPTASDQEVTEKKRVDKYVFLRHILDLLNNMTATQSEVDGKENVEKFLYLSHALELFADYKPPTPTDEEVSELEPVNKYLMLRQAIDMFERYKPVTASEEEVQNKEPVEKFVYLSHVLQLLADFTPTTKVRQPLLTAREMYLMRG